MIDRDPSTTGKANNGDASRSYRSTASDDWFGALYVLILLALFMASRLCPCQYGGRHWKSASTSVEQKSKPNHETVTRNERE